MGKPVTLARRNTAVALMFTLLSTASAVAADTDPQVNVYSARKEALIKPLLDRFTEQSGIKVNLNDIDCREMLKMALLTPAPHHAVPRPGGPGSAFQLRRPGAPGLARQDLRSFVEQYL